MATATTFDAKTNLSELIEKVQNGEEVIITSGRGKTPVAKLAPIAPVVKKRLGLLYNPDFVLADSFWDPLPEDELRLWGSRVSEAPARYAYVNLGYLCLKQA